MGKKCPKHKRRELIVQDMPPETWFVLAHAPWKKSPFVPSSSEKEILRAPFGPESWPRSACAGIPKRQCCPPRQSRRSQTARRHSSQNPGLGRQLPPEKTWPCAGACGCECRTWSNRPVPSPSKQCAAGKSSVSEWRRGIPKTQKEKLL